MMLLLAVYSTFSSAYFSCFGVPVASSLVAIDILVEIAFLIDMIFTFFQEYISSEDYRPVRDHKLIALRYLKRYFIFDLIALFPF